MRSVVAVKSKLRLCFPVIFLFAACDKPDDNKRSADESKPGVARSSRTAREAAATSHNKDLRDALAAALELESPEARNQALGDVVRNALERAPELADEAFGHLPADSEERTKTIRFIAAKLVEKNTDEALAWADALASDQEIMIAKGEIALILGASEPERAAKVLLESGNANRALDETAVQVLQNWAGNAPTDAAAWVMKLPPGESRKAGMQTVVSLWVQTDSKAAFSWVEGLGNQAARKEATRAIAEALVGIPEPIRMSFLEEADPAFRSVIEEQVNQIIKESESEMEDEPPEDSE